MGNKYWTLELCQVEAKKYKTKKEFSRTSAGCYMHCLRNKILDKVCSHMTSFYTEWTIKKARIIAKKYNTRNEFRKKDPACYSFSKNKKWLSKICKHMICGRTKWTLDVAILEAKKYKTRREFQIKSGGCYNSCRKKNWIEVVCKHMTVYQPVQLKDACKIASKYNTKKEFEVSSPLYYYACRRNKWMNIVCKHMISSHIKWTIGMAHVNAKKYKTRKEFQTKDSACYSTCVRNGWVDLVCTHMPKYADQYRHEEKIIQPKVQSFLKGIGFDIEKEVFISRNSRVDFVCTNKNDRKIIIEVKSHEKVHSKKELAEQISRYKTDGKKRYGNKYAKTYLVSLTGKYGYSLKELKLILKQDGLI